MIAGLSSTTWSSFKIEIPRKVLWRCETLVYSPLTLYKLATRQEVVRYLSSLGRSDQQSYVQCAWYAGPSLASLTLTHWTLHKASDNEKHVSSCSTSLIKICYLLNLVSVNTSIFFWQQKFCHYFPTLCPSVTMPSCIPIIQFMQVRIINEDS